MLRLFWVAILVMLTSISHAESEGSVAGKPESRTDGQEVRDEPFNRGIDNSSTCFIPKGTIGTGIAFSYSNYNVGENGNGGYNMLFSILQGVRGNMQQWSVAPFASYFIRDNLSVGLRFDYGHASMGLGSVDMSLMEGMDISIRDFNYRKQSYLGALTARYYMSIAKSKRFGMFVELRAAGGYGQSETYKWNEILEPGTDAPTGQFEKHGTYQDIYNFEVGIVPGLAIFVTNNVALEVQVGLLGLEYEKVCQKTNQVEHSEMEHSGANFRVNLLSLGIGISYFIPVSKKTNKPVKK